MVFEETDGSLLVIENNKLVTPAVVAQMQNAYPEAIITEEKGEVTVDTSLLAEGSLASLKVDLRFFEKHPQIPLENIFSTLENYKPQNESQEQALKYVRKLLTLGTAGKAGLFISGSPGIGKSHISVATAKELFRRGSQNTKFISGENLGMEFIRIPENDPTNIWIVDDINSPYGVPMQGFMNICIRIHERGGIILATGNTNPSDLFNKYYEIHREIRDRYQSRLDSLFKSVEVTGIDQRSSNAWFDEP